MKVIGYWATEDCDVEFKESTGDYAVFIRPVCSVHEVARTECVGYVSREALAEYIDW